MTPKLISCIIPVFNGERYLREAIESIFNQTYRPLEVIVVDDGSTDDTPSVVTSYGEQVRCLRQANAGPGAARNLGLTGARGEFVAFLDADDLWHPEKLARQMARFATRAELAFCLTHLQNFWILELQEEAAKLRDHRFMQPLPGYASQTLLAKRTVFDTIGQFNPQLIRLIIRYDGEMCHCCEDIYGVFQLGNVYHSTLEDLWFSERHTQIVEDLIAGRREKYALCRNCPQLPTGPAPDGKKIDIQPRRYTGETKTITS
ncbi:MAG: glycosyltransferase [Deltaproteobacteria bacterium]|nr:glycosyltransferase [Deltaproteobacteria bacterium]